MQTCPPRAVACPRARCLSLSLWISTSLHSELCAPVPTLIHPTCVGGLLRIPRADWTSDTGCRMVAGEIGWETSPAPTPPPANQGLPCPVELRAGRWDWDEIRRDVKVEAQSFTALFPIPSVLRIGEQRSHPRGGARHEPVSPRLGLPAWLPHILHSKLSMGLP